MDDLANEGETRSEWAVGREKETLDGTLVVPSNRATAALYTYTPWVLVGSGGNWLFWNVFQNYSRHLLKAFPNHRWIGGECVEHSDCGYDDGICMEGSEETSFCTMSCDRVCPDSAASHTAATFCADLGTAMDGTPAGWCLSRCDEGLFPETGCATGYHCVDTARFGESDVVRAVCWPGENPRHDSGIE